MIGHSHALVSWFLRAAHMDFQLVKTMTLVCLSPRLLVISRVVGSILLMTATMLILYLAAKLAVAGIQDSVDSDLYNYT